MNLKVGTPIPVFEYTEEESKLLELGLEDNMSLGLSKAVERVFWTVDSAYLFDEETQHSAFYSGGTSFISPLELDELIKLVNNNIK